MGSFGIPGLGTLFSATMKYFYGAPTESSQHTGTSPSAQNVPEDDEERVAPPPLRPMVIAVADNPIEPEKLEVALPPKKKKKKKNKKIPAAPDTTAAKSVSPVSVTPIVAPPVVVAVKPPPVVKLREAKLGTKLRDMIKPPVGEEGSKILFFLDHVFTPGEVPIGLGEHLVTYKIQDADGTISPEQHCTTLKILFDTPKLMKSMGFQRIDFGYIRKMTQMHEGKDHRVHITVPSNPQRPPTSLDRWATRLPQIYEGIFPLGGPTKHSGIHITYELDMGMNNSALYLREADGWKRGKGVVDDQDKVQRAVCKKAVTTYIPSLKPDLTKALEKIEKEFQEAVIAGRKSYVALNTSTPD